MVSRGIVQFQVRGIIMKNESGLDPEFETFSENECFTQHGSCFLSRTRLCELCDYANCHVPFNAALSLSALSAFSHAVLLERALKHKPGTPEILIKIA